MLSKSFIYRKNRNLYAQILLQMLQKEHLQEPFTKKPVHGKLATIPAYMVSTVLYALLSSWSSELIINVTVLSFLSNLITLKACQTLRFPITRRVLLYLELISGKRGDRTSIIVMVALCANHYSPELRYLTSLITAVKGCKHKREACAQRTGSCVFRHNQKMLTNISR